MVVDDDGQFGDCGHPDVRVLFIGVGSSYGMVRAVHIDMPISMQVNSRFCAQFRTVTVTPCCMFPTLRKQF